MSFEAFMMKLMAAPNDRKRDKAIPFPTGVSQCRDISYGPHGKWNLLDVYYPEGTTEPIPTIVSIHGGGYVYGTKEVYHRYGMDMARRGFAFVNFNYRLAPKSRFPAPLEDTNGVMEWIVANAQKYHLDPQRIILLGDSAGAQLTSHYAAIATNPEFEGLFSFKVPQIQIKAVGLFCGMYEMEDGADGPGKGFRRDYLGDLPADDPRLKVLQAVTDKFPPAFIATGYYDYLKSKAEPMYHFLEEKGVPAQWKCYGTEERKQVSHVFHVNIVLPEAVECNDDSAAFFRQYV